MGKIKPGGRTLQEAGQDVPTVTWSDGVLSPLPSRFCDFLNICKGLRRVFSIPCS